MRYLEFYRRKARESQAELGAAIGAARQRIGEYENGLIPTRSNLLALAGHFGIPASQAEHLLDEVPANLAAVPFPPDLAAAIRAMRGSR